MSSTNLTQPSPLAAAARGRLQFIDIAKGLGILSVILCHIFYQGQPINIFLYAYHMPLFFFVSGMFINSKQSLKTFFVKQLRTIYIPYAAFVYIDFLVRFVLYRASVYSSISVFRLLKNLVGLGDPYFNTPLWFLFSLFLIKMVAFLLHKIPQKTVRQVALGISFALSVAFILVRSRLELPSLNNYLAAIGGYAFFTLGTFLKEPIVTLSKKVSFEKKANIPLALLLFAGLFTGLFFLAMRTGQVNMHHYEFANPFLFLLCGVVGIAWILYTCVCLDKLPDSGLCKQVKRFLTFFGANSLTIMLTHYYITRHLFPLVMKLLGKPELTHYVWLQLGVFVLTVLLMVPTILFFNRFLFFLIGKPNPKKSK